MVAGEERIGFREPFAAVWAEVAAFAKEQDYLFSQLGNVLDLLYTVIMNPFCFSPTAGTSLFYRLGLDENFNERVCLNHFFNKNTFQVKESLGIIRVHL